MICDHFAFFFNLLSSTAPLLFNQTEGMLFLHLDSIKADDPVKNSHAYVETPRSMKIPCL
jgi:hypothetical protein